MYPPLIHSYLLDTTEVQAGRKGTSSLETIQLDFKWRSEVDGRKKLYSRTKGASTTPSGRGGFTGASTPGGRGR